MFWLLCILILSPYLMMFRLIHFHLYLTLKTFFESSSWLMMCHFSWEMLLQHGDILR